MTMNAECMDDIHAESDLCFEMEEYPPWRKDTASSSMLREVWGMKHRYDSLGERDKRFCCEVFAEGMAVNFACHASDIGSIKEVTKIFLDRFTSVRDTDLPIAEAVNASALRHRLKSDNIKRAWDQLRKMCSVEMKETGNLTVQQICDVHGTLLKDLDSKLNSKRGEIRRSEAYVPWYEDTYYYPPPECVEELFYGVVDHHCIRMGSILNDAMSVEKIEKVIKCAALLFFELVNNVHPFSNGNGRMGRLLANYVLSIVTPFPVVLYLNSSSDKHSRSSRADYLKAIVHCRKNPKEGPRQLAAIIVESMWHGWTCFFSNLESRQHHLRNLGPVVVKKSKEDYEQTVDDRVKRACHNKEDGVTERVLRDALQVICDTDVKELEPIQWKETSVKIDDDSVLVLKIFC